MLSCTSRSLVTAALLLAVSAGDTAASATGDEPEARARYSSIRGREDVVRRDLDVQTATPESALRRLRQVVSQYERLARTFPASGYSDNALWQGARLAADTYWAFGQDVDRTAAISLFAALRERFPTSSLSRQVASHVKRLEAADAGAASRSADVPSPIPSSTLKSIRRDILPGVLRLTLELERETAFHDERLDNPARVFVDLRNTRVAATLKDALMTFGDDVVAQVRVGRQEGNATRLVFDLQAGAARHSVYALYEPYRVVVDFERVSPSATTIVKTEPAAKDAPPEPLPALAVSTARAVPPTVPLAAPAANLTGGFSLSRQLGLGISRVVIDAGHGGHDPGALVTGLSEADLVLDVALRLEKLLHAQRDIEVVMTRRSNAYVPLEERTAIANRAGADLFLSIHANASSNVEVRGAETYFLNFAPNPEAEAIAARENAGASRALHQLPEIVKAIALNNKIDESREFATMMHAAMVARLQRVNRQAKHLGVKQAPFMVLIGATMPSALVEIAFLTNRQEAGLLKTSRYRQQIADGLFNGLMRYQKAHKATQTAAR